MLNCLKERCEVIVQNASALPQEEFALSRRGGLGASDSSIILEINPYRTVSDLVANKCAKVWTEEEQQVSKKPNVRKGADLEPLILEKFSKKSGFTDFCKPKDTYRLKEYPFLWINYDGLMGNGTPIEAKFLSIYGRKYWNLDKAIKDFTVPVIFTDPKELSTKSIKAHCETVAEVYGIPSYYYSQVQQQLLGTDAAYGYLTALDDKTWDILTFAIPRDSWLQQQLIIKGGITWNRVVRNRPDLAVKMPEINMTY